jgi:hypothetical protein
MLNRIELRSPDSPARLRGQAAARLAPLYPWLALGVWEEGGSPAAGSVAIEAVRWRHPGFDPIGLDDEVARALAERGSLSLRVADADSTEGCLVVARQVVTRYHRLIEGRNPASALPLFDRARGLFRSLHDLRKPLVAADHDHALDTWRWVLRLDPDAGLAVQLAALFHDIERLASESEVRVEHRSPDYPAFKRAHARAGAAWVRRLLIEVGAEEALADRVADLVEGHEQPDLDPDKQLLNEADALSFFSLNACGFARYYGADHTRRKVLYTLNRLGERGHRELPHLRHRADIAALIAEVSAP